MRNRKDFPNPKLLIFDKYMLSSNIVYEEPDVIVIANISAIAMVSHVDSKLSY